MTILDNDENLRSINSICSLLKISGENSTGFLNNLLLSDLSELPHRKFYYTALCNPKGRIITSLWINIISDTLVYLICPINMCDSMTNFFTMRKFRLKIKINKCNEQIIIDKNNRRVEINTKNSKIATIEDYSLFMLDLNLPWIDEEFTEKFIPQHVNLDQHKYVMSFTKGCYPGQEIIARIKYLGKIKKRMFLITGMNLDNLNNQIKDLQLVSNIIFNETEKKHYVQVIKNIKP